MSAPTHRAPPTHRFRMDRELGVVIVDESTYDHRNLASLFGYGREVHRRSGGVCQLCGFGAGPDPDAALWRQLTVEHLIGHRQGGYRERIGKAVRIRFPPLPADDAKVLASRIHFANMVTCCQFCNATTSRMVAAMTMEEVIADAQGATSDEVLASVVKRLDSVLAAKRKMVDWKMKAIEAAFYEHIAPELRAARQLCLPGRECEPPQASETTRAGAPAGQEDGGR